MIGTLQNGQVFLDTRQVNVPIRWEWGITGPYVPEGLEEGLAGARAGGRRLIVVPPELGYGASGVRLPQVHSLFPNVMKCLLNVPIQRPNGRLCSS